MTSMKEQIQEALGRLSRCAPPTDPLTYLPNYSDVTEEVRVELESPFGTQVLIKPIDDAVAGLVDKSFRFEGTSAQKAQQAGWFHDSDGDGCDCPDPFKPGILGDTDTVKKLTVAVSSTKTSLEKLRTEIQNSSGIGSTWFERITNKYVDKLTAAEKATGDLSGPLQTMLTSTNAMADSVFKKLREVIKEIREDLDYSVKAPNGEYVNNLDSAVADWLSGGDYRGDDRSVGTFGGMRAATDAIPVLAATMNAADDSVAAYSTALSAWKKAMDAISNDIYPGGPQGQGDQKPSEKDDNKPSEKDDNGGGGGTTQQTPEQIAAQERIAALEKRLDELVNTPPEDQPGNPFGDLGGLGGGNPLGGLGGLGGGNPLGGLGGLGGGESPFGGASAATDPFAEELFSDPEGNEDEDEDTDEDEEEKDAEEEEEEEEEVDPKSLEDPFAPVAEPKLGGEPIPGEPLPGEPLIPGTEAVVANPPIDPAAGRTVDVGGGRSVEFPNARIADTVRNMVDAEPQNPKSVYMAASEAGVNLPPMGQDIGSQVPPSLLREGDVVSSTGGNMGVYLGNGDVLMESGETKPLGEVSTFDGPNQGYFRLDTGELSGAGASESLSSPAQTVGDIEPEQTPVVENQGGTPGMPTDEDITVGDTSSGAALAQESGVTGLDPGAAFSS